MSKVIATYTGRFDVYRKQSNIKIQIISVPKQKNKIVMTGQGSFKNPNGSLLRVKKIMPNDYVKMYGVSIIFQNRGSHQGGPMHNFNDNIALFSKDEKHIDKLLQFLEKYITKKKVRRTSKKSKKGGCGQRGGKRHRKTSKKDKYICYTGIGSKKSGNHTEKEFLKVMNNNKYKFYEPVPKEVKTTDQWIRFSGAEKGKCKKDIKDEKISKKDKYISNATLKSLQKLSYHDLKNLSSNELQKYKKRVGIIDQEGNPFTDEDLIRMLRKYTSGNKIKTKHLTWREQQNEKIKKIK